MTTDTNAPAPAGMVGEEIKGLVERARRIAARLERACGRDDAPGTAQQTLRDLANAVAPLAQEVERLRGAEICAINQGQIFKRERDLALASAREMSAAGRLAGLREAADAVERVGNFGDYRREELTADFGQPKFDFMHEAKAAILALAGDATGKEG